MLSKLLIRIADCIIILWIRI